MNRRGFLGSILAAGVAPVVVKAGILMPVRPVLEAPKIVTGFQDIINGEIGSYESFRFIESRIYKIYTDASNYERITLETIRRATRALMDNRAPVEPYVGFVHPNLAADLRRQGFKVHLK